MKAGLFGLLTIAGVAVLLWASAGQGAGEPPAPRLANGRVDLSGIWLGRRAHQRTSPTGCRRAKPMPLLPARQGGPRRAPISQTTRRPVACRAACRAIAPVSLAHRPDADAHLLPLRGQHPQLPADLHGRPSASRRSRPHVVRPLDRAMGGRHAGGGHGGLQRQVLVRLQGPPSHRAAAHRGALHAHRLGHAGQPDHDRRSRAPTRGRSP